jgi:hypothetical protein
MIGAISDSSDELKAIGARERWQASGAKERY